MESWGGSVSKRRGHDAADVAPLWGLLSRSARAMLLMWLLVSKQTGHDAHVSAWGPLFVCVRSWRLCRQKIFPSSLYASFKDYLGNLILYRIRSTTADKALLNKLVSW